MVVSLSTLLAYATLLVLWLWNWLPACAGMRARVAAPSLGEAGGRPVLELHPQGEPFGGEHFLDLVERLAAEVGSLEQLVLGALDQVADVVDVLGLEAVGRTHRELQVVDRLQQDRTDLRLPGLGTLAAPRPHAGGSRSPAHEHA